MDLPMNDPGDIHPGAGENTALGVAPMDLDGRNVGASSSPPLAAPRPVVETTHNAQPETFMQMDIDRGAHDGLCPFNPRCVRLESNLQSLIVHVDQVHVARGQIPPLGWLLHAERWVCKTCRRLVPIGRHCLSVDCEAAYRSHDAYCLHEVEDTPRRPRTPIADARPPGDPVITPTQCIDMLRAASPSITHIPHQALPACTASFCQTLQNFNQKRTTASLLRVLAWPSQVLGVPSRGGKQKAQKNVRELVQRAEAFPSRPTESLLAQPNPPPTAPGLARQLALVQYRIEPGPP